MTQYGFHEALGGFFLADSKLLRTWLPAGLLPLEARPGHGILAVTAFDFVESEVGAYGEFVVSVLVPPYAGRGDALPHAATFPVLLATTTPASRIHASTRWFLPEHEQCLEIGFQRTDHQRRVYVCDHGEPILTLSVERRRGVPTNHLYQAFSSKDGKLHRVNLHIIGDLDEHQDETGSLQLYSHPLTKRISDALYDDRPITEQSIDAGVQRFAELVPHTQERT